MANTPTPKAKEPDVEKAAEKRDLSSEGSRTTIEQGEVTNPDYAGPFLVQHLHKRETRS